MPAGNVVAWTLGPPCRRGMGEVARPRVVTYSAERQQWFSKGDNLRRVFPRICVHRCNLSYVASQPSSGRAGHCVS